MMAEVHRFLGHRMEDGGARMFLDANVDTCKTALVKLGLDLPQTITNQQGI